MKHIDLNTISLLSLLALVAIFTLSSCRTMRGVGQDVQHAGRHIEHAAH